LTAETAREFYVFNHALRSATRVRFDVDERGVAEGLTIRRAEGNVRALRVRN
jgi:hypothetical protein